MQGPAGRCTADCVGRRLPAKTTFYLLLGKQTPDFDNNRRTRTLDPVLSARPLALRTDCQDGHDDVVLSDPRTASASPSIVAALRQPGRLCRT